jgi:6-pyruvoyltetrahydropterin/6-carboxytetrahydropterin synthase
MDCAHSVKALDGCDVTHGHTYKVEVVVEGPLVGGMVMDFKALRAVAKRAMAQYDHKDLSLIFDVPSAENIVNALFAEIKKELPGLYSVKMWEGYNKWAEATQEDFK